MVDPRESVPSFLAQYEGNTYVEGWAKLWDRGDCLHWDKGFPNPALEETLSERQSLLSASIFKDQNGNWQRRKALVPGCGRGVDVLLLASFGYDAYGLECSHSAIEACNAEEARTKTMYPIRNPDVGRGSITFVQGDFFKDGWLEKLGLEQNAFHLVYDHLVRTPPCSPMIRWNGTVVLIDPTVLLRAKSVTSLHMGPAADSASYVQWPLSLP